MNCFFFGELLVIIECFSKFFKYFLFVEGVYWKYNGFVIVNEFLGNFQMVSGDVYRVVRGLILGRYFVWKNLVRIFYCYFFLILSLKFFMLYFMFLKLFFF